MTVDFRPIITSEPNEIVSSDIFVPLPASRAQVKYVLVLYDLFSKHVKFYAVKKASAIVYRYTSYFQTSESQKLY
jgi:hypothetical protein